MQSRAGNIRQRANAWARHHATSARVALAPARQAIARAWQAALPARKGAAYVYDAYMHGHIRLRWRVAIAIVALILAGLCARAKADSLQVNYVHYNIGSAAVEATATATGPVDTGIAIGLSRGRCTARPAESEVQPGVTADGQPHQLLADRGASSAQWLRRRHTPPRQRVRLCVWTIHPNGAIGALYEERSQPKRRGAQQPALEGSSTPQAAEPVLEGSTITGPSEFVARRAS